MTDNSAETARELLDGMLPCRKCGSVDADFDAHGTQASLYCNECGQEEGVQIVDLFEQDERPTFDEKTLWYPPHAIERAKQHLIAEWNTRTAATVSRDRAEPDIDKLVEVGWAAIVGGDITEICHSASIIRADLKTAIQSILSLTPIGSGAEAMREAKRLINERLEDLETANELYGKDQCLNAPEKIERNTREASWLKDLRSILSPVLVQLVQGRRHNEPVGHALSSNAKLADELERLCCAETEGKFFDCVTDNIQAILTALRAEQAEAVMPLIGNLLDAWGFMPNDVKGYMQEHCSSLCAALTGIDNAMTGDAA